ncbi:MAG: class I SAM-dependent methyltransferase [Thermoanaerobaculia bacterium]
MSDERTPAGGLVGWREIWREGRLPGPPERGVKGALLRFIRLVVRRATRAEIDRQINYNRALLEMLEDERRARMAVADELRRDIIARREHVDHLIRTAVDRSDALLSAVDRKSETALARIRDLALPALERPAADAVAREEWLYRRLEEGLRGSEAEVREALAPYVERAEHAAPAVDVGCGRGEFLALCRDEGIDAIGYDTNERSVADLRARGLRAEIGAVPECLARHDDGSLGSILATHVVEHLPPGALIELFAQARRALRPGGLLMIETPNAEALAMSGSDFWRDPTHLAPRHAAALTLLAREYGFAVAEVRAVHPFPEARRLRVPEDASDEIRRLVQQLNAILFAGQDLRLVLRKE